MSLWSVLAAKIDPDSVNIPQIGADSVLQGVLTTVYTMAGIVCVIVIIVAGLLYTLSNGEAEKIKRSKNAILYAVVGLVIVLMAFVITNFIIGRF